MIIFSPRLALPNPNCRQTDHSYCHAWSPPRPILSQEISCLTLQCITPVLCPQCGSTGCLGLARFLSDCQSCLVFSGTPAFLARAPGEFGWCVQNESCLPVSGETQGGRKEDRREGLSLTLNKRCWELTWEGLDSCWAWFRNRAR